MSGLSRLDWSERGKPTLKEKKEEKKKDIEIEMDEDAIFHQLPSNLHITSVLNLVRKKVTDSAERLNFISSQVKGSRYVHIRFQTRQQNIILTALETRYFL